MLRRFSMDLTRRTFLEEALAAGALTSLLPASGTARSGVEPDQAREAFPARTDIPEHGATEFWNQFYLPVDPTVPKSRGPRVHIPPSERQVTFLHAGSNGLRYADDIAEDELLDYPGDVQVSIVVGQFRPGDADQDFLKHVPPSQLRVDCVQNKPYRDLLAPLAWCAMASLKANQAGKLPSLDALGFNAPNALSGVTKILLPGGSGKMAVNLYVTKGQSMIDKILKEALQLAPAVAQVMNFPAISVPALRTFSEIFGALEERSSFLMNSQLTDVVATKQAIADPDRAVSYLHLIAGEYVLVPKAHVDELKPHLGGLQLQQGYLVANDAKQSDPLTMRKDQAVPGVTYATLKISVSPATGASSGANPNASGGAGGSAESPAKKAGGAPGAPPKAPATEPKAK
jgi:hypothetical protein